MRTRLVFVCFVMCRLWWWWCWGVAGTAAAWSRDKTFLNCSNVLACVLAFVQLPCLL